MRRLHQNYRFELIVLLPLCLLRLREPLQTSRCFLELQYPLIYQRVNKLTAIALVAEAAIDHHSIEPTPVRNQHRQPILLPDLDFPAMDVRLDPLQTLQQS